MRFTTTKRAFAPAVGWVWQAVGARYSPYSEVPGVGLEVTGTEEAGQVRVVTADRGITAQVRLRAEHPARGRAVVDGAQLARILPTLPAHGPLQIRTDPEMLYVRAGRTVCSLRQLDNQQIPPFALPAASARAVGMVDGALLAEAVGQVATSAAAEDAAQDVQSALTAIRLGASRAWLSLMATDRAQLAVRELLWSWPHDQPRVALAPAAPLARLVTAFAGEPAVRVCFAPECLTLHTPTRRLTLPNSHGEGPPPQVVEGFMTRGGGHPAIVAREELRMACRQLKVYQVTRGLQRHQDRLELVLEPGQMRLCAQHEDIGRGEVILKADYDGPSLTVHLAYRYFLRAVNHAGRPGEELLEIEAASAYAPVWIRGQRPDGCALLTQPLLVRPTT